MTPRRHRSDRAPRRCGSWLCQLDLIVGDLAGNVESMVSRLRPGRAGRGRPGRVPGAGGLRLSAGGPAAEAGVRRAEPGGGRRDGLTAATGHAVAVVGWIDGHRDRRALIPTMPTDGPWNAAAVLHGGRVVGSYRKQALPNYGVFDEKRYFDPGAVGQPLFAIGGVRSWRSPCARTPGSPTGPVRDAARGGAAGGGEPERVAVPPGQAARAGADARRRASAEARLPVVYLNLVGGQDDLVFDGGSMVVGVPDGSWRVRRALRPRRARRRRGRGGARRPRAVRRRGVGATRDRRSVVTRRRRRGARRSCACRWTCRAAHRGCGRPTARMIRSEVWEALVLGVRDYVTKNGFTEVVIGLSGGVDSSIVAAIAVDALGRDRVHGVLMPSRYSSDHSVGDAVELSRAPRASTTGPSRSSRRTRRCWTCWRRRSAIGRRT